MPILIIYAIEIYEFGVLMKASFKPRARLLKLLGDQLIGTPQLAVFELVKNSYDADADRVEITILNPEDVSTASVEITDIGGEGMSLDTIVNIWLEPGADHKQTKRNQGKRTAKHNRLPLGEKGVGRFAVHKLGQIIELTTKNKNNPEIFLKIDWAILDSCKYIEDAEIVVEEREMPQVFTNGSTGTRIVIKELNSSLTRGDVRNLYRNIQSIKSPFEFEAYRLDKSASTFDVSLSVPGHDDWTIDLFDLKAIIEQSLFRFSFLFSEDKWSWDYQFAPNEQLKKQFKVEGRKASETDSYLELPKGKVDLEKNFHAIYQTDRTDFLKDLGPILGEVYVFDFDAALGEQNAIKRWLSENQGIRVYRDGIRVYNYGEPNDDWLEMDSRRVNRLGKGINRRIAVGAISLELEHCPNLIEKTNREGFIENETFSKLKAVVNSALGKLESLRQIDKDRLRQVTKKSTSISFLGIDNPVDELKQIAIANGWEEQLAPAIRRTEKRYNEMQDIMLTSGMAGLNMTLAFHEIQHGISDAKKNLLAGKDISIVIEQFDRFELLLDTYANLLKQEKAREWELASILQSNVDLADVRFTLHDIIYSCPVLTGEHPNFIIKAQRNLIISAVNNLIDNSIYWLDKRWGGELSKKYIHIGVSEEFDKGPAIVIADNGSGWRDISKGEMIKPFRTTKSGGMGIGLYYTDTVMQMLGGELVLLDQGEIDGVPEQADGAIVALVFNGGTPCKK
ncbi:ATP-binding protein [Kiloniella laminariae]|uniref:ATP-binding protein n=1 Tax=Kiloniella laminariae TaxID=454162 RepID=A0ABT4LFV3_9PROT|nr:ATP-binding protein [Kiloniella laminariae]MCZ4279977.1 ATP-binding protein [Kiloniella laminariae]